MPRLDSKMETSLVGGMQRFKFSATRTEHLGATEYTLVTIAVDVSGSTYYFADKLRECLIAAVESCKRSPRRLQLLLRVITFSSSLQNGYEELHGFKLLADIDTATYPVLSPGGNTPLADASYSAVGATTAYAEKLKSEQYGSNGIIFIITDGVDNDSVATPAMVREEVSKAVTGETIESLVTVLVGINAVSYRSYLEQFQKAAGIDKYVDAGEATPGRLAKLADFVSQSVSSQSQALGTGGPSQQIAATI